MVSLTHEEIEEHNARELAHIINQYSLTHVYKKYISAFLTKKYTDGRGYNKSLNKLKIHLSDIPFSSIFLAYLYEPPEIESRIWNRNDPIEKTPVTHTVHGTYFRLKQKSCCFYIDTHRGKPRPDVFVPEHNIMMSNVKNTIGHIDRFYTMIRSFGYNFQDILEIDGMCFKLYDIHNPLYLDVKDGYPSPIIHKGLTIMPMSNKIYTELYKKYVLENGFKQTTQNISK
jgi:hypothetical protein